MRIVAILLGAGSSRRFGTNKLLADYHGRPLYSHALAAVNASPAIDETVVVVNPHFPLPPDQRGCRFVVNQQHEDGMSSSLRAGITALPPGTDAFVLALADMPDIKPELVTTLVGEFQRTDKKIVIPTCQGRRGHPVVFSSQLKDLLLAATGDAGAREVVRGHPEMIQYFATNDPAVLFDVDLPADIA